MGGRVNWYQISCTDFSCASMTHNQYKTFPNVSKKQEPLTIHLFIKKKLLFKIFLILSLTNNNFISSHLTPCSSTEEPQLPPASAAPPSERILSLEPSWSAEPLSLLPNCSVLVYFTECQTLLLKSGSHCFVLGHNVECQATLLSVRLHC